MRTVACVDVLDDTLAALSTREIEVDVGPLAAFLGEKALEKQLHTDRIDRGNCRARNRLRCSQPSPTLHQDAALLAELDDLQTIRK